MDYRCWSTRGSKLMSRRAAGSFEEDVRRYSTGSSRASAGCAGLACAARLATAWECPKGTFCHVAALFGPFLWLERRYSPNREQSSLTQSTVYNSRKPEGESSDGSYSTCQRSGDQWSLRDIGACAGKRGPRTVYVRRAFPWRLVTTTFLVPPRAWMKSTSTCERTRAQMYARRRFPNRHRPFRLLA